MSVADFQQSQGDSGGKFDKYFRISGLFVEYRSMLYVLHKKKAFKKIETQAKLVFLFKIARIQSLFYYFCQEFTDSMAFGGYFASLAPLDTCYWGR